MRNLSPLHFSRRRGSQAIEFALCLPTLVHILASACIDFGHNFKVQRRLVALTTATLIGSGAAMAGDASLFGANNTQIQVPDYNNGPGNASSFVWVYPPPNAIIKQVNLTWCVSHPFPSDLVITVSSTESVNDFLIYDRGQGTYCDSGVIETHFDGEQAGGFWLNVSDHDPISAGTIENFEVEVIYENYAPNNFLKTSPTDGAEVDRNVTLTWAIPTDINGHDVSCDIAINDDVGTTVCDAQGLTANSHNCILPDDPGANFYFQVFCTDGIEWTDADSGTWHHFFQDPGNQPPNNFAKTSPADGALETTLGINFDANTTTDPDGDPVEYMLVVTDQATGLDVHNIDPMVDPGVSIPFASEGDYCFQYWAYDDEGAATEADNGAWHCFTIDVPDSPPHPFDQLSPGNDAVSSDLQQTFIWESTSDPEGTQITYTLEIHDDYGYEIASHQTTNTEYDVTLPAYESTFWRVTAEDANGNQTVANNPWLHLELAQDNRGFIPFMADSAGATQVYADDQCNDNLPNDCHMGLDERANSDDVHVNFRRARIVGGQATVIDGWGLWLRIRYSADPGECFYTPDGDCLPEIDCAAYHLSQITPVDVNDDPIPSGEWHNEPTLKEYSKFGVTGGTGGWPEHLHSICGTPTANLLLDPYVPVSGSDAFDEMWDPNEITALNTTHPATLSDVVAYVHNFEDYDEGGPYLDLDGTWTRSPGAQEISCGEDTVYSEPAVKTVGYNGQFRYASGDSGARAKWKFKIPIDARYAFYAYIPEYNSSVPTAWYWIEDDNGHNGGPVGVNQFATSGWTYIDTRDARAGTDFSLNMSFLAEMDPANCDNKDCDVGVDAVKAVYVGGIGGGPALGSAPDLLQVMDQMVPVGAQMDIALSATDADTPLADLIFDIDPASGAVITNIGPGSATLTFTPTAAGVYTLFPEVTDGTQSDFEPVRVIAGDPGVVAIIGTLTKGTSTPATIIGADPFTDTLLAYSTAGPGVGPCPVALQGDCVDLIDPQVFEVPDPADGNGVADFDIYTPVVPVSEAWLQPAAQVNGIWTLGDVVRVDILPEPADDTGVTDTSDTGIVGDTGVMGDTGIDDTGIAINCVGKQSVLTGIQPYIQHNDEDNAVPYIWGTWVQTPLPLHQVTFAIPNLTNEPLIACFKWEHQPGPNDDPWIRQGIIRNGDPWDTRWAEENNIAPGVHTMCHEVNSQAGPVWASSQLGLRFVGVPGPFSVTSIELCLQ